MYNRYARNDESVYRHIPQDNAKREPPHAQSRAAPQGQPHHPPGSPTGISGLLSGILGKFKLDEIDTGDLLLLVLLFLLFREGEDDELLIALGLLLIL